MTRPDAARCADCGLSYSEHGTDIVLPRAQWMIIAPHPPDGGILCGLCIARRVEARIGGATVIHAVAEVSCTAKTT